MSKNDSTAAIFSALTELWNLKSPGPNNLILEPAFIRLREACQQKYAIEVRNSLNFGLATALQKLGLPCCSPSYPPAKPLSIEQAVLRLDEGIKAKKAKRLYIAPLDLADNLPEMQFGSVRVLQPHTEKLQQLFAQPLVWSSVTNPNLEVCRFLEFHWLIVEEVVEIHKAPEERAFPFFSLNFHKNYGEIDPHKGRFPKRLEDALFFLLLAPWENLTMMCDMDWRGFHVPWFQTVDEDLFVSQKRMPSPDTLNWEYANYNDSGEEIEVLIPTHFRLNSEAGSELKDWDQKRWETVQTALSTPLFETPVVHFFVRAFLVEGIDEVLAHIFTIEAALGLHTDHRKSGEKSDPFKGLGATKRMKARVAGLLGGNSAEEYEKLFNIRSSFVHGRRMGLISSTERIIARSLARRVVEALICATVQKPSLSREAYLDTLLKLGA